MKTKLAMLFVIGINAWCLICSTQTAQAQAKPGEAAKPVDLAAAPGAGSEEVMPLINIPDATLRSVIESLARQANVKFLFDPRTAATLGTNSVSVRLENVTAQQALEAVLNNNNLIMVPDPKSKIARITDKPKDEPLVMSFIQLKYSSPTNIALVLSNTLPAGSRSRVIPDTRTSQLVVMATEKELEGWTNLINRLDTPTRQVLIEARLIETSKNPKSVKGIDWSGTLAAQSVTFGNGISSFDRATTTPGNSTSVTLPSGRVVSSTTPSTTTTETKSSLDGLTGLVGMTANTARGFDPRTAFLNADGVRAVLSFLNTDADSEVVATPRAVTLDNETAKLDATRSLPIFKITPGTAQTPAGSEVTYTNIGTILEVTPRIRGDDKIFLKIVPEVSAVEPAKDRQVVNGQINEANIFTSRRITANVVVPNGNTLVMGGLIRDENSKGYTKVPVLGDLPGIGLMFRRDSKTRFKSNLIIFITPTIVSDSDFQPAQSDFLKTPLTPDKPDKDESPWDAGKPHDWTKPVY